MLTLRVRERLIGLRDQAGMTDTALARASKQRQQDVSRFMLAEMKYPPLDFLDALCRVFQITLADVVAKDAPPATLTESELTILTAIRGMPPSEREAFERILRRPRGGGSGRRRG